MHCLECCMCTQDIQIRVSGYQMLVLELRCVRNLYQVEQLLPMHVCLRSAVLVCLLARLFCRCLLDSVSQLVKIVLSYWSSVVCSGTLYFPVLPGGLRLAALRSLRAPAPEMVLDWQTLRKAHKQSSFMVMVSVDNKTLRSAWCS